MRFVDINQRKNPTEYDKKVYVRYKMLLHETNMLYRDYDPQNSYL